MEENKKVLVNEELNKVTGGTTEDLPLILYGNFVCPYCHTIHSVTFGFTMEYLNVVCPIIDSEICKDAKISYIESKGYGNLYIATLYHPEKGYQKVEFEALMK